jgi:hypothetical protein
MICQCKKLWPELQIQRLPSSQWAARNLSTPLPAVDFGQKDIIEFSYNYAQAISDAQNYFPLFFHFDQYIKKQRLPSPVRPDQT